mgnify:CR=1 FL=1
MQNYLIVTLLLISIQFAFGQENYTKKEDSLDFQRSQLLIQNAFLVTDSIQEDEYQYLQLQFETIQTSEQRKLLLERGIDLIGYRENKSYLAALPQSADLGSISGLVQWDTIRADDKLSRTLSNNAYTSYALDEEGRVLLNLYPFRHASKISLSLELLAEGIEIIEARDNYFKVAVRPETILELAAIPSVFYLECIPAVPKYEGVVGRQQQRGNWLNLGPGSGLDGRGVALAIGDDGGVDHIDFAGRVFDHTDFDRGSHGDMTAGLAIGGGNLDPRAMGIAPAAVLHLYNIEQYEHIDQAVNNYQELGTVITSTSFWEGCGGDYTQSARELDLQVNHSISLLHCFSAGNQGDAQCDSPYGLIELAGGARFGNITGGRKASKHSIAVANISYHDSLILNSSRGPASDGRIKPDLAAPGSGQWTTDQANTYQLASGTSASAPTVAGGAALLYQAYRQAHGGVDPPAALVKTLLLNTADDLGRPGPDFEFGWGRPHLGRALRCMEEDPLFAGAVEHGAQQTYNINVPPGVKRLRVMLYWNDPAGLPMNSKALVNDLDLDIQDAGGNRHLPWVLSSFPHLDSLTAPASRGRDRLNNMEQVEMLNPDPGSYSINVQGSLVPEGPQTYFLSVLYDSGALNWAYPLAGESLVPGEVVTLRWDEGDEAALLELDYSLVDADQWTTIGSSISAGKGWYDWTVPEGIHGEVQLRIRQGQKEVLSDTINILAQPSFAYLPTSDDTAVMYWDPVPGADYYQIYHMGYQHMEKWAITQDTFVEIPTFPGKRQWYSIAAKSEGGEEGRRNLAQLYEHYECDLALNIQFLFDQFPAENRWQIQSPDGKIWASGGPYPNSLGHSNKHIPLCLPFGCYELKVFDAFEDGMCCNQGQGKFTLALQDGRILVEGGEFGAQVSLPFCLDEMLLPTLQAAVEIVQSPSCHDEDDGILQVNLADPTNEHIRYAWSTGDSTSRVDGLSEGQYYVTVSQESERVELSISLKGPDPLEVELHGSPPLCHGEASGWLDVMVMGGTAPYSFRLNGQAEWTQLDWDALDAGLYTLEVSDAEGCVSTSSVDLSPPDSLSISSDLKEDDGRGYRRFVVEANGGLEPYQYYWSDGTVGASLDDPTSSLYSVTVVDANACSHVNQFTIPEPTEICSGGARSSEYEWIEAVKIDSILFETGNNGGYVSMRDQAVVLQAGQGYTLNITPGFDGFPFNEYFGIWVDFNRDLDFTDPGEQILNLETWMGSIEAHLYIGTVISPGPLHVRVAMQYGDAPNSCGGVGYGEVEDYLVMVENPYYNPLYTASSFISVENSRLNVYPNPVSTGQLKAEMQLKEGEPVKLLLFDRIGRILVRKRKKGGEGNTQLRLDVGHLESGIYWMLMLDRHGTLLESRSIFIQNDQFRFVQTDD